MPSTGDDRIHQIKAEILERIEERRLKKNAILQRKARTIKLKKMREGAYMPLPAQRSRLTLEEATVLAASSRRADLAQRVIDLVLPPHFRDAQYKIRNFWARAAPPPYWPAAIAFRSPSARKDADGNNVSLKKEDLVEILLSYARKAQENAKEEKEVKVKEEKR